MIELHKHVLMPHTPTTYALATDQYTPEAMVYVSNPMLHQHRGEVTILFREAGIERYCCQDSNGNCDSYFPSQFAK